MLCVLTILSLGAKLRVRRRKGVALRASKCQEAGAVEGIILCGFPAGRLPACTCLPRGGARALVRGASPALTSRHLRPARHGRPRAERLDERGPCTDLRDAGHSNLQCGAPRPDWRAAHSRHAVIRAAAATRCRVASAASSHRCVTLEEQVAVCGSQTRHFDSFTPVLSTQVSEPQPASLTSRASCSPSCFSTSRGSLWSTR